MLPRRHSTKLPSTSTLRPITIRSIPDRPYAQSVVFSRSRGTATKRRTQGRRSGCRDKDDSRLLQQGPSNTLLFLDNAPRTATADVARPIVGGQKFDDVFLCSKIFRTPNQKNPDGHERGLAIRA